MSSLSHGSNAEPNLTPILDMVFQLITFFMLVINFKAASLDLELKLPVIGSARPVDTKGKEDIVILNVDREGQVKLYGRVMPDVAGYIAAEGEASRLAARRKNPDQHLERGDELPSTVVIRADLNTTFDKLYSVIKTCQDEGYRKFALKAMNKPQQE